MQSFYVIILVYMPEPHSDQIFVNIKCAESTAGPRRYLRTNTSFLRTANITHFIVRFHPPKMCLNHLYNSKHDINCNQTCYSDNLTAVTAV